MRSCLVSQIEGVEENHELEKLELYDNHIECIQGISHLRNLKVLDLSFNAIREMVPLSGYCPLLEELYIAQNKLRQIEGLEGLVHLRTLDLGANRIRVSFFNLFSYIFLHNYCCFLPFFYTSCVVVLVAKVIQGLETNTSLKSLWLGKNKIEAITGLETLVNLRQLDIQHNRLTTLGDGLRHLSHLEELYLAWNSIPDLQGLPVPSSLNTVDLSKNQIASLEGVAEHTGLEELWLSYSLLSTFESLTPLTLLPSLNCLYLEHSPIAKDYEYRKTITKLVPSLQQLDATMVNRTVV